MVFDSVTIHESLERRQLGVVRGYTSEIVDEGLGEGDREEDR